MNTVSIQEYQTLMTDIIHKQMAILGPSLPIMLSQSIKGLKVADDGKVLSVGSDPEEFLNQLITQYFNISESLVKISIFPQIEKIMGKEYCSMLLLDYQRKINELPEYDQNKEPM
jgi:hypothetical protein